MEQLLVEAQTQKGSMRAPTSLAPKKAHRLSEAQITDLIAEYQAGATTYAIADTFSTTRDTVRKHLRASQTKMRRRGLSPEQSKEAGILYREGWSSNAIAKKLEVSPTTVLRKFHELEIEIR